MKPDFSAPPPALSLQNKLDRIAHEREVLSLLRELARHGLCEGDPVQHHGTGTCGRIAVERHADPPRIVVALDRGECAPFTLTQWRRH